MALCNIDSLFLHSRITSVLLKHRHFAQMCFYLCNYVRSVVCTESNLFIHLFLLENYQLGNQTHSNILQYK